MNRESGVQGAGVGVGGGVVAYDSQAEADPTGNARAPEQRTARSVHGIPSDSGLLEELQQKLGNLCDEADGIMRNCGRMYAEMAVHKHKVEQAMEWISQTQSRIQANRMEVQRVMAETQSETAGEDMPSPEEDDMPSPEEDDDPGPPPPSPPPSEI